MGEIILMASAPFEFELHAGESAKFSLSAVADGTEDVELYRWEGVLDLLYRGKTVSVPVNHRGEMFSLVNRGKRPQYMGGGGLAGTWHPW